MRKQEFSSYIFVFCQEILQTTYFSSETLRQMAKAGQLFYTDQRLETLKADSEPLLLPCLLLPNLSNLLHSNGLAQEIQFFHSSPLIIHLLHPYMTLLIGEINVVTH